LPGPLGLTTVKLTTTAVASAGTPQPVALPPWPARFAAVTRKLRWVLAAIGPPPSRVSTRRHGVRDVNTMSELLATPGISVSAASCARAGALETRRAPAVSRTYAAVFADLVI
jgi:hypothetical protein